jgi:hypothetical protein
VNFAFGHVALPGDGVRHVNRMMTYQQRRCRPAEIGIGQDPAGSAWPAGEVLLASVRKPAATRYVLAIPQAVLAGDELTSFLAQVAPFGCPPPHSLIRAYSLPDSPYPSILLAEHEDAPTGAGEAYRRFVRDARHRWLAALQEAGEGLCPVLAWQATPHRRLLAPDEWAGAVAETGLALAGAADGYLGRGLLLLANPALAASWQTMMSLGGSTKARKITGREFPVWVDLPVHEPALLGSPLLARAERLLDET